ncbi:hypothetical protein [Frankia sp. EAN1pec]|uniref:hypothetical protein n=1 Tax=Parafrankia sp. (strain EAN1pec) TaxID=298653 RepID=UPI00005433B9
MARRRFVGALLIALGILMMCGGAIGALSTRNQESPPGKDVEEYQETSLTAGLVAVGGIYTSAAGLRLCLPSRRKEKPSRPNRIMMGCGFLLIPAGLAVMAIIGTITGFTVGAFLQAAGAVLLAIGMNAGR